MTSEATAIPINETNGGPSLTEFLLENGRLPYVTDEIKPWEYRGWIVPYIQLCEVHPAIAPRYDYVHRTVEAGRLLDEPIPQIDFIGEGSAEAGPGMKMLTDMVKITEYTSGYSRGFDAVVEWLAFGLGCSDKSPSIKSADQETLYRTFDISKWLMAPTDYLGQHMAEHSYGRGAAFFPTPMHLCTAMAKMTFPQDVDSRAKTTMDPCVGTGRLLLAASNCSLRLFGNDIMHTAVLATKINLAIYAPWHLIPESVFAEITESAELPPAFDGIEAPSEFQDKKDVRAVREVIFSPERLWSK